MSFVDVTISRALKSPQLGFQNIGDVYTMGNYTPGRISILIKIEETYVVEITNGNRTWEFVTEIKTTNSSQVTELFLQRKYEYMDGTFKWAEKQEQLDKQITKNTGFSKASDQTISLTSTAPLQDLVWNDSDSTVIAGEDLGTVFAVREGLKLRFEDPSEK